MKTEEQHAHIQSYSRLFGVLLCLYLLTGVTIGVSYIHMGILNVWVALLIASTKVTLVLLYFMHLRYESRVIVISFISTVIFLGIMIGFIFFDIAFR
jgi:cytochrome c oxidase subunit 4